MNRRLISMAGVVGMALALAACGADSQPSATKATNQTYHVVVLGGVGAQGVLADNSATSVLSAKAAVAWANAHGGVNGKKVTIQVVDDKADPTVAVTKLREAINSEKPDLVLNSGPSAIADATLPILKQNNILSFNLGPTATSGDPKQNPLNFDLAASGRDQVAGFVPRMKDKGYKQIGVLHGSTATGEVFGTAATEIFNKDFKVIANEEYDVKALDMTAQLEAIRAKNPDVLVVNAYGGPLGYILQGIQKLGWDVPIMGDLSVSATGLISNPPPSGVLGTDVVKNLVMQVFKSTAYDPKATRVVDAVKAMKAEGDIRSTLILAYNYDALPLVVTAAKKANSTDPAAIAKALEDPKVQAEASTAILDEYNYTADVHSSHPAPNEFSFISPSILKDGQFQPQS